MEKWDVAIVGGGPGGSYAAKTAAEQGLKTVFFERGRKPGEKNSSGCGLGQRWWRDFPEIMEAVTKMPSFRRCEMVVINLIDENNRLRYRSGTTGSDLCANRFPHGMDGANVYRKDLDPYLAGLATDAGAELRTSTLVNDVIMDNGRVTGVKTEKGDSIQADVVIAADGAISTMARKSGLRNRWEGGNTLVAQLDFSCDEQKMDDVIGPANWVWFGALYGAYQVNFRDGFHLGAGTWLDKNWDINTVDLVKRVTSFPAFQAMCRAIDAKPREYQAHTLPWLRKPPKTYMAGMMLVGDAAGFPCPLEGEGIGHALTSGKAAAETAAWALSRGGVSESELSEYEKRWKATALGKEHEFGQEFVDLWYNSIFDPKSMAKQMQLLLEFSMLHPFSIVFDWGDAHMDCFNQHLEHLLELAPQFSDFAGKFISPMARGIWPSNVKKILSLTKPKIPLFNRMSDETFFKVMAKLSRKLAPFLDPAARQNAPLPRGSLE
jgi:electron transfer flavoprotein-quinone oxidoreductase